MTAFAFMPHDDGYPAQFAYSVDVFRGIDGMAAVAKDWQSVDRMNRGPDSQFQSWSWCHAWATCWCGNNTRVQPLILRISDAHSPLAIVPLMSRTIMGVKVVSPLGEPHTQVFSPPIVPHANIGEVVRLIHEALKSVEADIVTIGQMPLGSPFCSALPGEDLQPDPAEFLSLVDFSNPGAASPFSKNRRRDYSRKMRDLTEKGDVRFRQVTADASEFHSLLEQSVDMKRRWLRDHHVVSSGFSWAGVHRFLARQSQGAGPFSTELQVLQVDGVAVAINLDLVGRGQRVCFLSAYHHDWAEFGVGSLLHHHAIQRTQSEGNETYSFLGHPTRFKGLWSNRQTELVRYNNALTWQGSLWLKGWQERLKPMTKRALASFRV